MDLRLFAERLERAGRGETALDAWSLYAQKSRRLSLGIKDREVGNAHAPLAISEGLGIRYRFVWGDRRVSRGYLERAQTEAHPADVLRFARGASFDDPDSVHVHGPAAYPEVALHDPDAAAIAEGRGTWLKERLGRLRESARATHVKSWSGSLSASEGHARLITSLGLDVEGDGTSIGWHATFNGSVGEGHGGRRSDSIEEFQDRLQRLLRWSMWLEGAAAEPITGVQQVLVHPDVVDRYAIDTLLHHLSGSTLAHGESRYPLEAFGSDEPRLPERFSLRLDPLRPYGSGSYRFSQEGVPAARFTYVENGRLIEPLLDMKYAHRLHRKPTPLPYSGESLEWDCGPRLSFAQATGGDRVVLVVSVLGIHTQDSASGDFSLAAPQALVFDGGDCIGRQQGTISGNLFQTLEDADLRLVDFPGEEVPGMLFACRFDPR